MIYQSWIIDLLSRPGWASSPFLPHLLPPLQSYYSSFPLQVLITTISTSFSSEIHDPSQLSTSLQLKSGLLPALFPSPSSTSLASTIASRDIATTLANSLAFPLVQGSAFRPAAQAMDTERRERLEVEVDPEGVICREAEVSSSSVAEHKQEEEVEELNNYSPSPRASPTPSTPGQTLLASPDFTKPPLAGLDFKTPGTPLDFSFTSPRKPSSPPSLSMPLLAPIENIYESAAKLLFMSVKWSRSIPSFQQLPPGDQQLLLESGWSQLFILSLAQWAVSLVIVTVTGYVYRCLS